MSTVGGGEDGASFVFEKVDSPDGSTMTMVFSFPSDFEKRALSYRKKEDMYAKLRSVAAVVVKAIKIFTAFGLIISLAILIVAGLCILVAAVIALARGGGQHRGNHHQILMHKVRFLLLQLRQILWLYAICGGGSQDDPFMREVAGDLAFMLSFCVGNPMHMWFWMRMGRRRHVYGGRGWGYSSWRRNWRGYDNNDIEDEDGVAMIRRGSWGNSESSEDEGQRSPISQSSTQQQRGLLSIAVEFLFGPSDANENDTSSKHGGQSVEELERWKFRAAVIMALSTSSEGKGVSLRELLPYTDNPPSSVNDASALRETMKIISYFNGKPADIQSEDDTSIATSGIDARFFVPEIMAEMETGLFDASQKILSLSSSQFAPPSNTANPKSSFTSILYKRSHNDDVEDDATISASSVPQYLYENPKFLTQLSQQQFGQCCFLGLLNYIGILSVQAALDPGGLFDLTLIAGLDDAAGSNATTSSRRRRRQNNTLLVFACAFVLKLLKVLRFYANLFVLLPLLRLGMVLITNYCIERRNQRRLSYVTE